MAKPKIGIIGVCSYVESGAQRYEELMAGARKAMEGAGLDVVISDKPVYTSFEALAVCSQFKAAAIESVCIMDVTWVCDSLKYIFVHELKLPVVFWAVPYTETFSIGCVQNFGSVLHTQGIHSEYVYGLPTDAAVIGKIKKIAIAGQIVKKLSAMRIALVGPRQTWRVAGPQDMTMEEWDFSQKLGPTLIHMEMEEITDKAREISDKEAEAALDSLKNRTGKYLCTKETMLWMAKVYLATKNIMQTSGVDIIAAECYPAYGGLMNQPSSWLEDDGYIVDTEGDISNALIKYLLNMAASGGCCALGEVGSFDDDKNYLSIAHEGSTPASLAESLDKVQVSPSGDTGCFVGIPLKPMKKCTVCDMQGTNGSYQLMITTGEVLPATHEEWVTGGEKLLIKLRIDGVKPSAVIDKMIASGFHHHLVVKEGDFAELMQIVCKYTGIKVVTL
jgi:L-fucose isomerase-like protein